MHITMITATPRSVRQGSGTFVALETLTPGLEALGHRVEVVAPARGPGMLGYTLHRFRFNRSLRAAQVASADLVVGWDMDGYRLAGKLPCPFVTYVHGQLADEARFERGFVAHSMHLQARTERRSTRRADRVLTVSQYARRRLIESYALSPACVSVVPPAFDVARWREALERLPSPTGPSRPTVLSVARMYPRKNLQVLVTATALMRARLPDVRVRLIGDGPERGRLERQVRRLKLTDSVEFAGQVTYAALVEAYAGCDVFCLPSLQEGFGIVFLEAMIAGKPVVACRGTAAEELVDPETGILVPTNDAQALADALYRLLTDPVERARVGSGGPARAEAFAPLPTARRFMEAVSRAPTPGPRAR